MLFRFHKRRQSALLILPKRQNPLIGWQIVWHILTEASEANESERPVKSFRLIEILPLDFLEQKNYVTLVAAFHSLTAFDKT